MKETVLFVGAGFSKASGLRTTGELERDFLTLGATQATPSAELQAEISRHLESFWSQVFGYEVGSAPPSLEDHFTLIDGAANTGHNLGAFDPKRLRAIRRFSIHRVFDVLDQDYKHSDAAADLVGGLARGRDNAIVTTNWDTAVERYLVSAGKRYQYGLETFELNAEQRRSMGIPVFKLHGSSNWMYCDNCRRVFVGHPGAGKAALHSWTFLRQSDFLEFDPRFKKTLLRGQAKPRSKCTFCSIELGARIATFSFRKALGFFQFQAVWDAALRALSRAKTWVFIGYSLPQADFEIRSLLKAAEMAAVGPGRRRIIAVPGRNEEAVKSFKRFFGTRATVCSAYLDEWWGADSSLLLARTRARRPKRRKPIGVRAAGRGTEEATKEAPDAGA